MYTRRGDHHRPGPGIGSRQIETHAKDIDRDTRRIINAVKEGVGKGLLRLSSPQGGPHRRQARHPRRGRRPASGRWRGREVEATAPSSSKKHLAKFAVEIKNTTGATRDAYRKVQEQTTAPETLTIELRANEKAATKNAKETTCTDVRGSYLRRLRRQVPRRPQRLGDTVVTTEMPGRRSSPGIGIRTGDAELAADRVSG